MNACLQPADRPIIVAGSEHADAGLARAAIEELGRVPVLVQGVAEVIRLITEHPKGFAAVVVGERIGPTSGFTLCGVARDAGCRLPMLLLTGDDCRWTAVRAARLRVSVLWQPVPASRIAQTLRAMLPARHCAAQGSIRLPSWPQGAGSGAPAMTAVDGTAGRAPAGERWTPSPWPAARPGYGRARA
jgi:hypothetical protein